MAHSKLLLGWSRPVRLLPHQSSRFFVASSYHPLLVHFFLTQSSIIQVSHHIISYPCDRMPILALTSPTSLRFDGWLAEHSTWTDLGCMGGSMGRRCMYFVYFCMDRSANNFCVVGKMILSLSNPFGLLDLQSGVAKVLFNALANACASSGQWRESLLVCSEARSRCHQIRALFQSETNLHTGLGSPIECRLPHDVTRKLRIYVSAYCSCLAFLLSSQSNSQMWSLGSHISRCQTVMPSGTPGQAAIPAGRFCHELHSCLLSLATRHVLAEAWANPNPKKLLDFYIGSCLSICSYSTWPWNLFLFQNGHLWFCGSQVRKFKKRKNTPHLSCIIISSRYQIYDIWYMIYIYI